MQPLAGEMPKNGQNHLVTDRSTLLHDLADLSCSTRSTRLASGQLTVTLPAFVPWTGSLLGIFSGHFWCGTLLQG